MESSKENLYVDGIRAFKKDKEITESAWLAIGFVGKRCRIYVREAKPSK